VIDGIGDSGGSSGGSGGSSGSSAVEMRLMIVEFGASNVWDEVWMKCG
jgi:hypothetical protein